MVTIGKWQKRLECSRKLRFTGLPLYKFAIFLSGRETFVSQLVYAAPAITPWRPTVAPFLVA